MNKSALREAIETIVVVTLITVLVWLYAEGESVRTYKEEVRVKFVAPPAQNLLIKPMTSRTDTQGAIRVQVTFRASAHQHQEFREKTGHNNLLKIAVPGPGDNQPIVLKDALLQETPIGELGLNIEQTDPRTETVDAEQLTTVTLPVRLETGGLHLAGTAKVAPSQVKVTLPKQFADLANNARVMASLSGLDPDQLTVDQQHTARVRLTLPGYLSRHDATLETAYAKATFTIENLTDTVTLASIPIHLNATPLLLRRYQIKLSSDNMVVRDVKLTGPADEMTKIREKQIKVWAEIRPTMDEMSRGVTTATLYIHKPEDVQVVSPIQPVPITVVPQQ